MAFDLQNMATKILRCRTNLNMNMEEIHNLSGISVERLKQIESAKMEPTGGEILIFADIFKEDFNYFISNEKLSASEKVEELYRKSEEIFTKDDRMAIQEFISLCENEQFVWDELHKKHLAFNPNINMKHIYSSDGEKVATQLRKHLGYSDLDSYQNLYENFRRLGIHIFRRTLSKNSLSGLFIRHPFAGFCVLINNDENIYRQNFTLAHEIGHALMDGTDYNISLNNANVREFREIRANKFASSFLLPKDVIKRIPKKAINVNYIKEQANMFRVNVAPFLIALKNCGIINEREYQFYKNKQLVIHMPEQIDYELDGLTTKLMDSYRHVITLSLSPSYIRDCHEAYEKEIISEDRLAEMLLVNIYDLPKILNLFSLKLNYEY
jgi:Zn-dependent peptidase ImmA (M78 family)/transcriptional regulator with XRE-family HTH domain